MIHYLSTYSKEISETLFKLQFKEGAYTGELLFEVIEKPESKYKYALVLPEGPETELLIYLSLDIDAIPAYFEIFDINVQRQLYEIGKTAGSDHVRVPFSLFADDSRFETPEE